MTTLLMTPYYAFALIGLFFILAGVALVAESIVHDVAKRRNLSTVDYIKDSLLTTLKNIKVTRLLMAEALAFKHDIDYKIAPNVQRLSTNEYVILRESLVINKLELVPDKRAVKLSVVIDINKQYSNPKDIIIVPPRFTDVGEDIKRRFSSMAAA